MEKRDIIIIAAVILLSIGIRILRSKRGKKKGVTEKTEGSDKSKIAGEKDDGYEPYSGKQSE